MTAGPASRLARTSRLARIASIVTLAGALSTGLTAAARIASAPHDGAGAVAATAGSAAVGAERIAAPPRQTSPGSRSSHRIGTGPHASGPGNASPRLRGLARATPGSRKAQAAASAAGCMPTHTVRPGETLSSIADRCYGSPGDWQAVYGANTAVIADPDLIYPGQVLTIPARPAHAIAYVVHGGTPVTTPGWHRPPDTGTAAAKPRSVRDDRPQTRLDRGSPAPAGADGRYGCGGLEALWDQAGGNPADARLAAGIALAESGGNPGAVSPTDDYGLWQINASNGALATLSPQANARSAVILSHGGTDWSPWTTYRTGAYRGRC